MSKSPFQHRLSPPPGNWFRPRYVCGLPLRVCLVSLFCKIASNLVSISSFFTSVPSEDQCIDSADVRGNTIIRTNASRAAGAVFIDSSTVRSSHECVAKCCSVSSCNLAIVDSKVSSNHWHQIFLKAHTHELARTHSHTGPSRENPGPPTALKPGPPRYPPPLQTLSYPSCPVPTMCEKHQCINLCM